MIDSPLVTANRAGMTIVFYLWFPAMNGIKGINPGFYLKKKKKGKTQMYLSHVLIPVGPSCEIMRPVRWVAGVGQRRGGTSSRGDEGRTKKKEEEGWWW